MIHCSWCFPNITQTQYKIGAWSHQKFNHGAVKDRKWILDHVRLGYDLFERDTEVFDYIPNNTDVPDFILQNRERFSYMLDRKDRPNADFLDVDLAQLLGRYGELEKDPL